MSTQFTLLTGATGFIGSHVAERLLGDRTWPVIAIVRGGRDYKNTAELKKRRAILVQGVFYDPKLLLHVFTEYPIQNVVHIAALTGDGKGRQEDYEEINVRGTERLLSFSHRYGVDKFIYCSSVGVYGAVPDHVPAGLSTRLNPDSRYHQSKFSAEQAVQRFISKGLDAFIIRPTIAYGLRDRGFPFRLIRLVRKRLLLLPFRNNQIHLVSVSSLADMFMRILKVDGLRNRVFIAADEGPVLLRDLINLIHSFYFGRDYPRFLKLPDAIFAAFEMIFRIAHFTRAVGRIQRLSRNWSFDTRETNSLIGFHPAGTRQGFLRYLRSLA